MRPNRLEVSNFLAYRDCELDLSEIHIACLVGENGAGKSSLLDAITWALWGKARGRRDADLIRLGADDMTVALDFYHTGHRYRVIRAREKSGRSTTGSLTLMEATHDGDWFDVARGQSIREAQQVIDTIIGLDYDTFVNTAFLRQGKADTFTTQTPAKRKAVLREILRLQDWEGYERAVLDSAKDLRRETDSNRGKIELLDESIALREDIERECETARGVEAEAQARADSLQSELDALAEDRMLLSETLTQLEAAWQAEAASTNRIESLAKAISTGRGRLEADADLIARREEIESGYERLTSLRETHQTLAAKGRRHAELNAEIARHEAEIDKAEQLLQHKATMRHESAIRLEQERNALILRDDAPVVCPECGQPLDEAAQAEMKERRAAELAAAEAKLKRAITLLDSARMQLSMKDYAETARSRLMRAQQAQTELAHDEDRLHQVSDEISELGGMLQLYPRLTAALAGKEKLEAELARLGQQIEEAEAELKSHQTQIGALSETRAGLETKLECLPALRSDHENAVQTLERARRLLIKAEEARADIDAKAQRRDAIVAENEAAEFRLVNYDDLAAAFGPNGVPLMVIKSVTREIEHEANAVLERISNGAMSVRLRTERELVSGGVAEALDIQISDALGVRDYEMYSGGEAFKVDVAIRIGLSKVLARRAGAKLRTLFVDEGFGSQDIYGRERLAQTITALRPDFDLILVVTHLEELRDHFDTHIHVTKRASGSVVEVA